MQRKPGAEKLTTDLLEAGEPDPGVLAASAYRLTWTTIAFIACGPGLAIVATKVLPDAPGVLALWPIVWTLAGGSAGAALVGWWQRRRVRAQLGIAPPNQGWIGVSQDQLTFWRMHPMGRVKAGPVATVPIAGWRSGMSRNGVLELTAPDGTVVRLTCANAYREDQARIRWLFGERPPDPSPSAPGS